MNTTEMEIAFLEMLGNAIDVDLMKIWKNYSKACIHVFRRFYTVKLTESVYLSAEIFPEILGDLLSYTESRYKRVLELYFTEDAKLTHPLLNVEGTHNIRKVYRVWTSLNAQEPEIKEYPIFNGDTAIIHLVQHLRPRILPFIHFEVPSVTILRLREDVKTGLLYIYRQEDDWTLEGLIQSVPIINWWYEKVVRVVIGGLIACTGGLISAANSATSRLTIRASEFRNTTVSQGQSRALSMAYALTDSVKSQFQFAQESVLNQYDKVRGVEKDTYINGSKDLELESPKFRDIFN
ncbi:15920_t:CDS:2 [Entrophospora sp. SA101]|nr:15920_t:CDS:2 [Entrophospora sp. SA101]